MSFRNLPQDRNLIPSNLAPRVRSWDTKGLQTRTVCVQKHKPSTQIVLRMCLSAFALDCSALRMDVQCNLVTVTISNSQLQSRLVRGQMQARIPTHTPSRATQPSPYLLHRVLRTLLCASKYRQRPRMSLESQARLEMNRSSVLIVIGSHPNFPDTSGLLEFLLWAT